MKIKKFKKEYAAKCSQIIYSCIDIAKKLPKKDKDFLKNFYTPKNIIKNTKYSDFFVVFNDNNKIIGMGRLDGKLVATVYFDPKFHRQRGGTSMMRHLEKLAIKKDLKSLYLHSLLQSTGFYEKMGFLKDRRLEKPVRAYNMKKTLR